MSLTLELFKCVKVNNRDLQLSKLVKFSILKTLHNNSKSAFSVRGKTGSAAWSHSPPTSHICLCALRDERKSEGEKKKQMLTDDLLNGSKQTVYLYPLGRAHSFDGVSASSSYVAFLGGPF